MLAADSILRALRDHRSGLAVSPLLDAGQVRDASIDLRLGPDLIITQRATGVVAFDPADVETIAERLHEFQQYVRRPAGSAFYLHPGEFALARTLEYVKLPPWLSGEAMGRSSWGRLGLVIATATLVQPEFGGTITLELCNLGSVPIVLYVGLRICQLVLYPIPGHETTFAQYTTEA